MKNKIQNKLVELLKEVEVGLFIGLDEDGLSIAMTDALDVTNMVDEAMCHNEELAAILTAAGMSFESKLPEVKEYNDEMRANFKREE